MPEYTVMFVTETSSVVTVEAENPEAAIDLADADLPGSLCHECAGMFRDYNREEGDWEPVVVTDADGNEVWTSTVPDPPGAAEILARIRAAAIEGGQSSAGRLRKVLLILDPADTPGASS